MIKACPRTAMQTDWRTPCDAQRQQMKIIHLAPHCDEVGNGVVNAAIDLACFQAKAGHDVIFASPGGSYEQILHSHFIRYEAIRGCRVVDLTQTVFSLRRLFQETRPDVVHAHMISGALLAWFLRGRPAFRLVTTVHNGPSFRSLLMGIGDRVISVSKAVATEMEHLGFPRGRLRVVRNGPLGSPRRDERQDQKVEKNLHYPAIVTIAGLYSHKGVGDLIEAFSLIAHLVPLVRLYIVGDGPDRVRFERKAARKACADRIIFTGFVPDPRVYLRNADLFVLASRRESFGLVIAEAREAGCAIIASNVGGIPEALDSGSAGVLVPPRQPRILATVMLELLQDDNQRRLWSDRAATNLGWLHASRVTAETLAVYREDL